MDFEKVKELNENILCKATDKLFEKVEKGSWSSEEFEVMSKTIKNLEELKELEKTKVKETYIAMKKDAYKEETEFETLIYKISEKKANYEGMMALTTVIADHMEDLRILQPRMYNNLMMKLKELL